MNLIKNLNIKNIIIIVLFLLVLLLSYNNSCLKRDKEVFKNNIEVLQDSIHTYDLKNGNLLSSMNTLILEKNELEKYLDISKKERKEIEKALDSSLEYIAKIEGTVKYDTIKIKDTVVLPEDSGFLINFSHSDEWLSLNGETKLMILNLHSTTTISNVSMSIPVTLGYTEDKQIFLTSENPYVKFTDINSAAIKKDSERKKRWNIGVQAGFGVGYDLIKKDLTAGPYIGLGISYGFNF